MKGDGQSPLVLKRDFHVHFPEGAIPKDGPSAGVAVLCALASLVLGRRLSNKLAMTGEISLRGSVLPVGGIKEKLLAAHRSGLTQILLPKDNAKDLDDLPAEVRKALNVHLIATMNEALDIALGSTSRPAARSSQRDSAAHRSVVGATAH
jgi:ATP-dependent Lon protease